MKRFAPARLLSRLAVLALAVAISVVAADLRAQSVYDVKNQLPPPAVTQELDANIQAPAAQAEAPAPKGKKARQQASAPVRAGYPYYVEFRSRYALSYGHTFMAYGRLSPDGKIATQTIIGLHPKGDDATWWSIGHVVWVPSEIGPSDGDLEDEYISARYRIDLTPQQYQNVVAFAKDLGSNSPMWHAVLYNCSAFVAKIANHMGLKSPPSLDLPADFINGMRQMNGGRRTISTLNQPS